MLSGRFRRNGRQDLQALAWSGAGPNGGQIYLGRLHGRWLPPRSPSASAHQSKSVIVEYDRLGYVKHRQFNPSRAAQYRGNASSSTGNDAFNSRQYVRPTQGALRAEAVRRKYPRTDQQKGSRPFFIDVARTTIDDRASIKRLHSGIRVSKRAVQRFVVQAKPATPKDPPTDRLPVEYQSTRCSADYTYTQIASKSKFRVGGQFSLASRGSTTDVESKHYRADDRDSVCLARGRY